MDEVDRVLERLRRIETLRAGAWSPGGGSPGEVGRTALLGELRALVGEAEAWARLEGDDRARTAVAELRTKAEGMG